MAKDAIWSDGLQHLILSCDPSQKLKMDDLYATWIQTVYCHFGYKW